MREVDRPRGMARGTKGAGRGGAEQRWCRRGGGSLRPSGPQPRRPGRTPYGAPREKPGLPAEAQARPEAGRGGSEPGGDSEPGRSRRPTRGFALGPLGATPHSPRRTGGSKGASGKIGGQRLRPSRAHSSGGAGGSGGGSDRRGSDGGGGGGYPAPESAAAAAAAVAAAAAALPLRPPLPL